MHKAQELRKRVTKIYNLLVQVGNSGTKPCFRSPKETTSWSQKGYGPAGSFQGVPGKEATPVGWFSQLIFFRSREVGTSWHQLFFSSFRSLFQYRAGKSLAFSSWLRSSACRRTLWGGGVNEKWSKDGGIQKLRREPLQTKPCRSLWGLTRRWFPLPGFIDQL